MAAVFLMVVALVVLLQLRESAMAGASDSRSRSIAARTSNHFLHRIRAARVQDLYDGQQGDFSDQGFPDFVWTLGLGDGSAYSGIQGEADAEEAWRQAAEQLVEQSLEEEEGEGAEFTRVFLTVEYPSAKGGNLSYGLETLLPTWAIEQDFESWEEIWGEVLPAEIE